MDQMQSGFLDTLHSRARLPLPNHGTHALRSVCGPATDFDDQNTGEMQLSLKRHFRCELALMISCVSQGERETSVNIDMQQCFVWSWCSLYGVVTVYSKEDWLTVVSLLNLNAIQN